MISMNIAKIRNLIAFALLGIALSGCMEAYYKKQLDAFQASDQAITSRFMRMSEKGDSKTALPPFAEAGWTIHTIKPDLLVMEKKYSAEWGPGCDERAMRNAQPLPDLIEDAQVKTYVEAAKTRGSTVKLYTKELAKKVAEMYPCEYCSSYDVVRRMYLDGILIEQGADGKILSFMLRSFYFGYFTGVSAYARMPPTANLSTFVTINYNRSGVARLDNSMPASALEAHFIKAL